MLAIISPSETLQAAINAMQDGSLFALFALPIALIFGIMRLVNFAHGEFIMVGAMLLTFMSGWKPRARGELANMAGPTPRDSRTAGRKHARASGRSPGARMSMADDYGATASTGSTSRVARGI